VLRLLNEPTAAAIAYGLDNGVEGRVVVYDLGGGTFDVSVLHLSRGVFEVVATGGDSALGGDDFDRRIVEWALRETGLVSDKEPDPIGSALAAGVLSSADLRAMTVEARRAKEVLSEATLTTFACPLSDASAVRLPLARERLDAITADLVSRTITVVRRTLRDARVDAADAGAVVLVGGATRTPAVRAAVASFFGRKPR
jgi:molecular chaperone HscA